MKDDMILVAYHELFQNNWDLYRTKLPEPRSAASVQRRMRFLMEEARRKRKTELPEVVELFDEEPEQEKPKTCSDVPDIEFDIEFFGENSNAEISEETVPEPRNESTLSDFEVPNWPEEFHSEFPDDDEFFFS
jgi:hypothetical protein